MEMKNLLKWEWKVNSSIFASKNRYRASIGDALIVVTKKGLCTGFCIAA